MKATTKTTSYALRVVIFIVSFSCFASAQLIRNSENMRPTGKGLRMQMDDEGVSTEGEEVDNEGAPRASVAQRSNGITYHGVPVMAGKVNVYFIWYGDWNGGPAASDSPMTVTLLNSLYANNALGGSGFAQIASTY